MSRKVVLTLSPPATSKPRSPARPSPSNEHPPHLPANINDGKRTSQGSSLSTAEKRRSHQPTSHGSSPLEYNDQPHDSQTNSPADDLPEPAPPPQNARRQHEFTGNSGPVDFGSATFAFRSRSLSPQRNRATSPTITEFMMSGRTTEDLPNLDFVPFSMPDDLSLPIWAVDSHDQPLIDNDLLNDDTDIIGPIQPTSMDAFLWPSRYHSPLSPGSPLGDGRNPFNGTMNSLYMQPSFPIESQEFLCERFDSHTCGILSVIDGPTENPWRSLVWPLAQESPALLHALLSMTAFHASSDFPALRVVGHEHKHRSIQNIQEGIRDDSMTNHTAIATALALGFAESWDQHTATGNTHIKGAQVLVKQAMREHALDPLSGVELARLKFLINAWVYMDVMARLTSVDSDESNDFDNTFIFAADPPPLVMGNEHPGFGIDFGMPIDARLDPLMGCAGTLFPLIGRVANLVRKVCRSQINSPGIISQARDLVESLENWSPPEYIERPEDPTTDVQHALQTAEAYRWATLLHLHQAVRELPSMTSAEFAQRALQYLATVPLSSRTMNVHVYPMMVAGCEATDAEDRDWVRGRWSVMAQRLRIGVVEKCLAVTEEVWRRKDLYESVPRGQRRLCATAEMRSARRRGAPLTRRPPAHNASPGRTGMVFSYVDNDNDASITGKPENRRQSSSSSNRPSKLGSMYDPDIVAYTVRGHLHWVGVMWEWGWEGK